MVDLGTATSVKAVTPSDSVEVRCRAIYVGGAGNVSILAMDDNTPQLWEGVQAGTLLPVCARLIRATGTTATKMLSLF